MTILGRICSLLIFNLLLIPIKVKENSLTGQIPYDKVLINAAGENKNTRVPQRKGSLE